MVAYSSDGEPAKWSALTPTTPDSPQKPSNVVAFQKIAKDIGNLYERKNADYGNSFSETYKDFGIVSALTRMSDKWNRIKQLALSGEQKIKAESLRDSLLDLASYCIMTSMEISSESTDTEAHIE